MHSAFIRNSRAARVSFATTPHAQGRARGAGCMMTTGRRLSPTLMAAMLCLLLGSAEAHLVTVRCAHHPRKQTPLPPRPTRVPRPLNHTPRSRTLPPPPQRCHSRRLALAAWSQVCTATAKSTCAERAVWFLFGTYHSSGSTVQGRIAITPPEETEYTTAFGDSCDAGGRAYATYIGDDPASASDYDCEIPGTGGGDEGTKSCRHARDIMNKCGPSSGQANGAVGANKLPADADITCYAYNHSTGRTVAVDPMTDAPFPLTQEVYNNRRSGLSVKSGSWYHHIRSYHLAKVTSFGSGTYKVRTLNTGFTMDPCDGADHYFAACIGSAEQDDDPLHGYKNYCECDPNHKGPTYSPATTVPWIQPSSNDPWSSGIGDPASSSVASGTTSGSAPGSKCTNGQKVDAPTSAACTSRCSAQNYPCAMSNYKKYYFDLSVAGCGAGCGDAPLAELGATSVINYPAADAFDGFICPAICLDGKSSFGETLTCTDGQWNKNSIAAPASNTTNATTTAGSSTRARAA